MQPPPKLKREGDLNKYAKTIADVFDTLAVLYKEGASSGDWDEAACSFGDILTPELRAEIAAIARSLTVPRKS